MKNKIIKDLIWIFFSLIFIVIIMKFISFQRERKCRIFKLDNGSIIHIVKKEDKSIYYRHDKCPFCNDLND
jgi:hypothetical protein